MFQMNVNVAVLIYGSGESIIYRQRTDKEKADDKLRAERTKQELDFFLSTSTYDSMTNAGEKWTAVFLLFVFILFSRMAQRYGTMTAHTRRRASVLVVFVVFARAIIYMYCTVLPV